jgi:voltage-gated potassium channel Kch
MQSAVYVTVAGQSENMSRIFTCLASTSSALCLSLSFLTAAPVGSKARQRAVLGDREVAAMERPDLARHQPVLQRARVRARDREQRPRPSWLWSWLPAM